LKGKEMTFPITKQMRQERRKRAEERNAVYSALSLKEKLARLPPEPQASRQRAKLLKLRDDERSKNAAEAALLAKQVAESRTPEKAAMDREVSSALEPMAEEARENTKEKKRSKKR
jgi:hypothetical protein